jgi:hypothetical protein
LKRHRDRQIARLALPKRDPDQAKIWIAPRDHQPYAYSKTRCQ